MLTLRVAVATIVILAQCTAFGAGEDVALEGDRPATARSRLHVAATSAVGPIEASGHRAVNRLVGDVAVASPGATNVVAASPRRRWAARHPILFGALAGAVLGTAVAAAAWGGEGAFVGLYGGAAAGAVVGAVLR